MRDNQESKASSRGKPGQSVEQYPSSGGLPPIGDTGSQSSNQNPVPLTGPLDLFSAPCQSLDQNGCLQAWNQAFIRMMSREGENLSGQPFRDFIIPEDRKEFDRQFLLLLQEGSIQDLEISLCSQDGAICHVSICAKVQYNHEGEIIGVYLVLWDMTEHKASESDLRENAESFRNLALYSPVGISVMRADRTFEYFNPRFTEILGYTLEDLPDKDIWFEKAYPDPDYRRQVMALWKEDLLVKRRRDCYKDRTLNVRTKDGKDKIIHFRSVVMGNDKHLMTYEDMTEQKKLEEELLHSQKMEAIGTLAGGIAHDINNLLMAIQGNVSLMLLNTGAEHDHYKRLKNVEGLIKSGADLANQLLGFAQGGKYELKAVNMNEILQKTASMFGRTKKEITIYEKYQKDLWTVEVDRSQMEQVLMNLYVNAWQAMPAGGDLYLHTENVCFDEGTGIPHSLRPGRYVKISVIDTGVGMDEKTRERIFDPFFTTKDMGRGTGLGLAMVYGIVTNHGGMIDVITKKGYGSHFIIYLPVAEIQTGKEVAEEIPALLGNGSILLVDDEETNLSVMEELLVEMGYRILKATSGQEAIDLCQNARETIDIVILDVTMPGMGGGETFDILKSFAPDLKVILTSGYSLDGPTGEIMKRGPAAFLQKPFRVNELSGLIKQVLSAKKS